MASVVASAVLITGCALPIPIQIASWALDGGSILATGKTLGDHGISFIAEEDCALWRIVAEGPICRDAEVEALAGFDTAAGPGAAAPSLPAPVLVAGAATPSDPGPGDVAYVIGTFATRADAETLAQRHRGLGTIVVPVTLANGRMLYRVAVGPFTRARLPEMRRTLVRAGIHDPWAMRLD